MAHRSGPTGHLSKPELAVGPSRGLAVCLKRTGGWEHLAGRGPLTPSPSHLVSPEHLVDYCVIQGPETRLIHQGCSYVLKSNNRGCSHSEQEMLHSPPAHLSINLALLRFSEKGRGVSESGHATMENVRAPEGFREWGFKLPPSFDPLLWFEVWPPQQAKRIPSKGS